MVSFQVPVGWFLSFLRPFGWAIWHGGRQTETRTTDRFQRSDTVVRIPPES